MEYLYLFKTLFLPFLSKNIKSIKVNSFDIEIEDKEGKKDRFIKKDVEEIFGEIIKK
jgi:hypothetical protein